MWAFESPRDKLSQNDLLPLSFHRVSYQSMLHFQKCLIVFHITIFITQLDKKREWEMMCRVKPDVVKDKETERNLQRIATR